MGGGGLALYLVLWLAMCLFKIIIIEVDASLKWLPWQSKLNSGTCITQKKKQTNKKQLAGFILQRPSTTGTIGTRCPPRMETLPSLSALKGWGEILLRELQLVGWVGYGGGRRH